VDLRHEHLPRREAKLAPALAHVIAHRRLCHLGTVLINQAPPNPLGRVTLLARRVDVRGKPLVDQLAIRTELRRRPAHRHATRGRQRRRERLTHRTTMHPVTLRKRPNRQRLPISVPSDLLELLHP